MQAVTLTHQRRLEGPTPRAAGKIRPVARRGPDRRPAPHGVRDGSRKVTDPGGPNAWAEVMRGLVEQNPEFVLRLAPYLRGPGLAGTANHQDTKTQR